MPIKIGPQPGPQEKFLNSDADIVIFGGARGGGKSYALLMDAMRYCINNRSRHRETGEVIDRPAVKNFNALLLRKSYQQIYKAGGLYSASQKIYPHLGAHFTQTTNRWTFPSGGTVDFGHMEHEQDKDKYLGLEIPWIGFDEVNQFSESQFWFMTSSNRSTLGIPSRIRATCNPDSSSWVRDFIEWWIDIDTGWPIPERDGVIRWFVRLNNEMYWGSTKDELWESVKDWFDGDRTNFMPSSATFIKSLLEDNRVLEESDPGYRAKLLQMPEVDRQRFLEGNWLVSPTEGSEWEKYPEYFDRHIWTDYWPDKFISSVIFIDPSKGKTDRSDFSAIVFVGLHQGKMFVRSDIKKRPAEQIVEDALRMYRDLNPTAIAVEENNFQDLLAPIFDQECERQNFPPMNIYMVRSIEKKEVRIRSLGPFLARQKIKLHKSNKDNRILYGQLKDFGIKGRHDDGPDALEGAIRVLRDLLGTDPMDEVVDSPEDDDDEPEVEYAL